MRRWAYQLIRAGRIGAAGAALCCGLALAEDLSEPQALLPGGAIRLINGMFFVQDGLAPSGSEQAEQPEVPAVTPEDDQIGPSSLANLEERRAQLEEAGLLTQTPKTEVLTAGNIRANPAPDVAAVLEQSETVQTVNTQRRNPASFDPRVRAYRYGQLYTQMDGAYWLPIRQDLDTPLSMISPSIIENITVIPGPYALQYGPGFSFINVQTAPTPRYACGFEAHANIGTTYYGNGDQLFAHERFYGGNANWGFSILHGTRTGNAYESGDGTLIPADYNNQNFFGQLGFDLNPFQHLEFRYLRQDQTDTQYPGQFFATDFAVTEGFNLRLIDEAPQGPWTQLTMTGWYNRSRFKGATDPGERQFGVVDRVTTALGTAFATSPSTITFEGLTDGDVMTTGGQAMAVYGEVDEARLTVGTDVRYVEQSVNENFMISSTDTTAQQDIVSAGIDEFSTTLPRSYFVDPGIFTELSIPLSSYWTTAIGGRVDFLHSDVQGDFQPTSLPTSEFEQNNVLYAFYLNNNVQLDHAWQANLGFGHAQRPPTLIERYSDRLFLGVIQSGFSRVIGDPSQSPERLWQFDVNLAANYDNFRGRVSGFYGWVSDYSTFTFLPIVDPTGARVLFTDSTDLATLSGFEAYGEMDLNAYWTFFTGAYYVEGRDQTIGAPLAQIYPFEGQAGLRLHDPTEARRWGIEWVARMVAAQDRLGTFQDLAGGETVAEQRTAGFTVSNLRSYYNFSERFAMVAGINNVFDRNYLEHLSLRLPAQNVPGGGTIPGFGVLAPGFTPYVGVDWTY